MESIGEIPSEEDFVTGGNITGNGQYLHHSLELKILDFWMGFLFWLRGCLSKVGLDGR